MLTKLRTRLAAMLAPRPNAWQVERVPLTRDQFLELMKQIAPNAVREAAPRPQEQPQEDMPSDLVAGGWARYVIAMQQANVAGWSFCRFACRGMVEVDPPTFFFGNVRGDYGVFTIPMPVCLLTEEVCEEYDLAPDNHAVLANLVHLPSGVGLGVFETRQIACRAGELLDGVLPPFEPLDHTAWQSARDRVKQTWAFNGIAESPKWHAHPSSQDHEVPIYAEVAPETGRPEKLT